jgi:hypothetical protein
MKDWRTYFKTQLTKTKQFVLENEARQGETDTLILDIQTKTS